MPNIYREALDPVRRGELMKTLARQRLGFLALVIVLGVGLAQLTGGQLAPPLVAEALLIGTLFAIVRVFALSLTIRTLQRFGRRQDAKDPAQSANAAP